MLSSRAFWILSRASSESPTVLLEPDGLEAMAESGADALTAPEPMPSAEPAAPEYDDCLIAQELFDQQMQQQAAPQPEGPYEQLEQMYGQQLEQMLNPYMMPRPPGLG